MRVGYIRIDKAGPSEADQAAALALAGVEEGFTYVDRPGKRRAKPGEDVTPQRAEAIRALRDGDELAIHSAARLGTTRGDVLRALGAVGRAGAVVHDCHAGEVITPHPAALCAIAFAERAESQGQQERAARARRGITKRTGPAKALNSRQQKDAKALWQNPEMSARQVAEAAKCSVRTLYRLFGPKRAPVPKAPR